MTAVLAILVSSSTTLSDGLPTIPPNPGPSSVARVASQGGAGISHSLSPPAAGPLDCVPAASSATWLCVQGGKGSEGRATVAIDGARLVGQCVLADCEPGGESGLVAGVLGEAAWRDDTLSARRVAREEAAGSKPRKVTNGNAKDASQPRDGVKPHSAGVGPALAIDFPADLFAMASPREGLGGPASGARGDEQGLAIQATNVGEQAPRLADAPSRAGDSEHPCFERQVGRIFLGSSVIDGPGLHAALWCDTARVVGKEDPTWVADQAASEGPHDGPGRPSERDAAERREPGTESGARTGSMGQASSAAGSYSVGRSPGGVAADGSPVLWGTVLTPNPGSPNALGPDSERAGLNPARVLSALYRGAIADCHSPSGSRLRVGIPPGQAAAEANQQAGHRPTPLSPIQLGALDVLERLARGDG